MFTKYLLPLLAVAGLGLAVFAVVQGSQTAPQALPVVPPVTGPKFASISGAGLVEARTENIPIGVNVPGVVIQIHVKKGDHVTEGQELFTLDDTDLKAQLAVKQAELISSEAQLHKLRNTPRPEDEAAAMASLREAEAHCNDAEAAMARTKKLYDRQMVPPSDYDKDRFAYDAAKAAARKAKAEYDRIRPWAEDIKIAEAAVELARADVKSINDRINLLTIRARTEGDVLQLNVRKGQFAAMNWKEPMILLGDVTKFHVRVDIDENDLPLFDPEADAIATLKGRPGVRFPLRLKYVEPYVIPKQSLTGANTERVDTRVLQAVYELPAGSPVKVYVGQQMDVYIRAARAPKGIALDFGDRPSMPFDEGAAPAAPGRATLPTPPAADSRTR